MIRKGTWFVVYGRARGRGKDTQPGGCFSKPHTRSSALGKATALCPLFLLGGAERCRIVSFKYWHYARGGIFKVCAMSQDTLREECFMALKIGEIMYVTLLTDSMPNLIPLDLRKVLQQQN